MTVLSIVTRNALSRVGRDLFKGVLDSSLQIPYNSMVVVSDSDDDTDSFMKCWCAEHRKELVITKSNLYNYHRATRATARQTAIDIFLANFCDEFLMFLDDDCVLNDGWWRWIVQSRALEDSAVGEVV